MDLGGLLGQKIFITEASNSDIPGTSFLDPAADVLLTGWVNPTLGPAFDRTSHLRGLVSGPAQHWGGRQAVALQS